MAPLFDELGLRILCTFSGDSRFREVQTMHRAEANMVVCSKAMLHVARKLKDDYGTPLLRGQLLRRGGHLARRCANFARLLGDPDLTARTEALIAREEARVEAELAPLRKRLAGKRVLIFTGGYKSWSVVSAMQDLGMVVVATGTEKSTEEDKARIRALMGPDALMISDNDQTALIRTFHECHADILIAGDRYIYPTLKSRIPFLDIDHVRRIGYAGYDGLIELARNLDRAVHSPVWERFASRPPGRGPREGAPMAEIVLPSKALTVNPLKASQPIGASLAFLGLADAMPLEHGARGCTSFNKLFFMRHFHEPIALQTTAMEQLTTVLGADGNVVEALATICGKNRPRLSG